MERFAAVFARDFEGRLEPTSVAALAALLVEYDHGGYNPRRAEDMRAGLAWRDAPSATELAEHWQIRFPDSVVAEPGLEDLLEKLVADGHRLGVVTNGLVAGQNAKIDRLRIRRFLRSLIVSEGVGCAKPDPRIFELACGELDVAPRDCWFVGDHPVNDVLAAARLGMTSVWIARPAGGHSWPNNEPAPDYEIASLLELPGLLAEAG